VTYKKKLIVHLSLIAALALTYTASLVFDPQRTGARSVSYLWLDPAAASKAGRIVINIAGETKEFLKINGEWFVLHNGREYPARQLRIEDFLGVFTQRAAWPVRSSSVSAHANFGLHSETAARITISGDNITLLDLLIGDEDNTGRECYVRRFGDGEVRSGSNLIVSYINSSVNSWYNLRLIPQTADGEIAFDSVQRVSVSTEDESASSVMQIFSRRNREWVVSGINAANPDQGVIDSYIRSILSIEGEDFIDYISADAAELNHSRIALDLGNGATKIIRLSASDESGRRYANVSGSGYVYSLAPWSVQRLFRSADDFETR